MKDILTKLPKSAQDLWENVYSSTKSKFGELKAERIAWATIRERLVQKENLFIARSEDFELTTTIHYEFEQDGSSISRASDGFSFVDYTLATSGKHYDNLSFGALALDNMMSQINSEGLVGRIDKDGKHSEYDKLLAQGYTNDEVEEMLQGKTTGIKAISAYKSKNKIIARIKVRNELLPLVNQYHGLSVEARVPKQSFNAATGVMKQARLYGFVLTNKPADPNTVRMAG